MSGIVTLTPSSAIDQTYILSELRLGSVNRAGEAHKELSGKGVNVARAIALAEVPVRAVLAVGTYDAQMVSELDFTDILRVVSVPGATRVNTTIVGSGAVTTKVNQKSLPVSVALWDELCEASLEEIARLRADWLVLCGSVPTLKETGEMVPFDALVKAAVERGVRVAVDTSGPALERLAADLTGITVIKPNTHELAEVLRRPLHTVGDVIQGARGLLSRGCEVVYVSMGEDGALALSGEQVWLAHATPRMLVNATGAGDASLAGFLAHANLCHGHGIDVGSALAGAASWGALSVSQSTTLLAEVGSAPHAQLLESPDPSRILSDPAEAPASPADRTSDAKKEGSL